MNEIMSKLGTAITRIGKWIRKKGQLKYKTHK
jgi:hypothetical protein